MADKLYYIYVLPLRLFLLDVREAVWFTRSMFR